MNSVHSFGLFPRAPRFLHRGSRALATRLREVMSICIRHRDIKLVPSSQENMTIKFEFRAVVSRVVFYEFSSNNFQATFEAPSYHFSQKIENHFLSS